MMKMPFSILEDLLSYTVAINKKIKNISPKIFGWVLFKLGSGDLCQVRQKMNLPTMLLP